MNSNPVLDQNDIFPIKVLDAKFLDGIMSRESRWSHIQKYFLEFTEFLKNNRSKDLDIEIIEEELILVFRIIKSKTPRIKMLMTINEIRSVPFITLADGDYEPLITILMSEFSTCSNHFLDIGANMGYYALALASNNASLAVDAFEPLDKMEEILQYNLKINDLETRVKIHKYGLGNENFETKIYVPKFTGSSGASLVKLHPEEGEHAEHTVQIKKLDSLTEDLSAVDLIKIDVEGAELSTLQGAINLISANKPTIMVELLRKWMSPFNSSPQDVVDLLSSIGYEAYSVSHEKISRIDSIDDKTIETNFLFCHPKQIRHFEILSYYFNRI